MSCGCPAFMGSSMPGRGGPACIDIGEEQVPSDTAVTEPKLPGWGGPACIDIGEALEASDTAVTEPTCRCSGVIGGEDVEGAYCDDDCGDMGTA